MKTRGLVLAVLLAAMGPGCTTVPTPGRSSNGPILDDVSDLRRHPQYQAALAAAPDFTREALTRLALRDHALNSQP